jgi:hypothetical protein
MEIAAKIEEWREELELNIVKNEAPDDKIVGSYEGGTKKIVMRVEARRQKKKKEKGK